MGRKLELLTSVAVAALLAGAPGAFGSDISQNANNTGKVTATSGGVIIGDDINGVAAGASVNATGAAASVGVLGVNTDFVSPGTFGNINQSAINSTNSDVTILGTSGTPGATMTISGAVSGNGSSASIGATGALSSVSVSGIDFTGFSNQSFGDITQISINSSDVINGGYPGSGNSISVGSVIGHGASASISATGAASSVAAGFVNSSGNVSFSDVRQTTTHSGHEVPVRTVGSIGGLTDSDGGVAGNGASVMVSATGAASSVSASYINSSGAATLGNVTQNTTNGDNRGTNNNSSSIGGWPNNFTLSGIGSSASITSTGAASAVSLSGISATPTGAQSIGNVTQITSQQATDGGIKNSGQISYLSGLSGHGASANVSATGAASAVSISQIRADGTLNTTVGDVIQATTMGSGGVTNTGRVIQSLGNGLTGDAASVSISATGAISSLAASYVNSSPRSTTEIGSVTQITTKGPGSVINSGWITSGSSKPVLSGDGASISISATGAASIVGSSFINSGEFRSLSVDSISQRTENSSDVSNSNVVQYGSTGPATIDTGAISGNAASVAVGATGAVSSVSLTSVNNKSGLSSAPLNLNMGPITQTSINSGSITNNGGSISTGAISGKAASIGINATGAASSVNISNINDARPIGATNIGKITQTAVNTGPITNVGSITTAGISGNGASVSVSAAGAVAAVSFSAIK